MGLARIDCSSMMEVVIIFKLIGCKGRKSFEMSSIIPHLTEFGHYLHCTSSTIPFRSILSRSLSKHCFQLQVHHRFSQSKRIPCDQLYIIPPLPLDFIPSGEPYAEKLSQPLKNRKARIDRRSAPRTSLPRQSAANYIYIHPYSYSLSLS